VYVLDKSTRAKWNCQASFDLFFPEKENARHFHYMHTNLGFRMQSVNFGSMMKCKFSNENINGYIHKSIYKQRVILLKIILS